MNNVKIKYCVWQARNAQVIYAEKPQIKKTVRKPWYLIHCKWYVVSFTERVNWNYAFSPFNKFLRIWVFATNPNFIIPKSQQPDDAYLSYFKLTLFDLPEFIVWNIYGLRHLVLKKLRFKNPSLWQRLNSFETTLLQLNGCQGNKGNFQKIKWGKNNLWFHPLELSFCHKLKMSKPYPLHPDGVNLLSILNLEYLTEFIVWNINGFRYTISEHKDWKIRVCCKNWVHLCDNTMERKMLKLFSSVNLQDCPDIQIDKKHSAVKMFKDVYYSSIYRGM